MQAPLSLPVRDLHPSPACHSSGHDPAPPPKRRPCPANVSGPTHCGDSLTGRPGSRRGFPHRRAVMGNGCTVAVSDTRDMETQFKHNNGPKVGVQGEKPPHLWNTAQIKQTVSPTPALSTMWDNVGNSFHRNTGQNQMLKEANIIDYLTKLYTKYIY